MGLRLLKSKRVLMGMTQEQLAAEIGINTKSYNMRENGKQNFKLEEVIKISKSLDLTLDEVDQIFLRL
ncbi:MAG: helix-turn-helix transcriptional regulator [Peptostreptococcaceae bacterium]